MKKFSAVIICLFVLVRLEGQNIISAVAGGGSSLGDGGPATSAQLCTTMGLTFDAAGNMYIADFGYNRIRKVTPSGTISTVVGVGGCGSGTYSGDNGLATAANIYGPTSCIFDAAGNMYIADANNNRIRKVFTNGVINTIAGTGVAGYSGNGGPASAAKIQYPGSLYLDASNNLYFCDTYNHAVRKVDNAGTITTVAGTGTYGYTGDGGAATSAQLDYPYGITFDSGGNMYVTDEGNRVIRKVNISGIISTFAGNGMSSNGGDGGPALSASFVSPTGIIVDAHDNLYISDAYGECIRKIDTSGIITTIAGNGIEGYQGNGGDALAASMRYPQGMAFDASGNLYVADSFNEWIRKVTFCQTPAISSQPVSVAICEGSNTVFHLLACRATSFAWQVDTTGNGNFTNLANNSTYLGVSTDKLTLTNVSSSMNGYVYRCLIQDSVSIASNNATLTVYAMPAINVTTSKPTYCHPDSILLQASGAVNYYWSAMSGSLSDSTLASVYYYPDTTQMAAYVYVNGIDSHGCTGYFVVQLTDSCGYVWPGDADDNRWVDNNDLLPIGLYFGMNGPSRSTVTNSFSGYICPNWGASVNSWPDPKFSDCNGDGSINYNDTLAISLNMFNSHPARVQSQNQLSSANPDIYLQFNRQSYAQGDTLVADVFLGSSANIQTNVYGLAFEIFYDPTLAVSGSEQFYFSDSWLGTINSDMIKFSDNEFASGAIYASAVRINHTDVSGYGKLATLSFVAADTFSMDALTNSIYGPIKISSAGVSTPLLSGVKQFHNEGSAIAYPNPVSDRLTIESSSPLGMIEVFNTFGEIVYAERTQKSERQLDLTGLRPGLYLVKAGGQTLKIIKQ